MEFKFLIIGPQNRDLSKIIQTIQDKNDNFVCCKRFVNNIEYKDKESIDELLHVGVKALCEEKQILKGDKIVVAGGNKALANLETCEACLNTAIGGIVEI